MNPEHLQKHDHANKGADSILAERQVGEEKILNCTNWLLAMYLI